MSQNQMLQDLNKYNKWIAIIIWLALLIANLATSITAVSAVMAGGILSTFSNSIRQYGNMSGNQSGINLVAFISGVLAIGTVVLILVAWLRFAHLSQRLVVSYAWLEENAEEATIFSDLLIYSPTIEGENEDQPESDLERVEQTLVSDVIRYLAFAWGVMLAISPVSSIIGILFSKF
jgi:hypothetical protein